jgi:hypothetical protein
MKFWEQALIAFSILAVGFLLIDPFMYERAKAMSPATISAFAMQQATG